MWGDMYGQSEKYPRFKVWYPRLRTTALGSGRELSLTTFLIGHFILLPGSCLICVLTDVSPMQVLVKYNISSDSTLSEVGID